MVSISKITLHNFLSFSDEVFTIKDGIWLVVGKNNDNDITDSNGSGKSALFDGIVYAIYGKLDRKVQKYGTNDTYVKLEFKYKDDDYSIIRYYKHYKENNNVYVYRNEEEQVYHTKKEKENFIKGMFKLPYEFFLGSIFIKQGFMFKLSSLSNTQRKDWFTKLIDIDFNKIYRNIKRDYDSNVYMLNEKNNNVHSLEVKKSSIEGEIKGIASISGSYDNDKIVLLLKDIKSLEKEISDKEKEKLDKEKERNELFLDYNSKLTKANMERMQLKKLRKGVCPVCGSKIDVKNVESKINELNKKIITLKNDIDKMQKSPILIDKELDKLKEDKNNKYSEYLMLSKDKIKMKTQKIKLRQLNDDLFNVNKQLDKLQDEQFNLSIKVDKLNSLKTIFSPSGELRSVLLKNYLDVYNQLLKSVIVNIFPEKKHIRLEFDDNMGIEIKGVDYSALSGGEKRRLDFVFQLVYGEFISLFNGFDCNIRVFDEVFDNLDEKAVMQILNYLKEFFYGKVVYFISHNEFLKDEFDNKIIVEKTKGNSKIIN